MLFDIPGLEIPATAKQKARATEGRRSSLESQVLAERRGCAADIAALRKTVPDDSFPELDSYLRPVIANGAFELLRTPGHIWNMLKAGCESADGFTTPEGFVRINIRDLINVPKEYEEILAEWKRKKAEMDQAIIDRVLLRDARLKELQPGVPITAYYGDEI